MDKILLYFSIKYRGNWNKIYEALEKKEQVSIDELNSLDNINNYITILDNKYPEAFKNAFKPPFVIYYSGNIDLFKSKSLSITGDNKQQARVGEIIENLDKRLFTKNSIVSGGYSGTDKLISTKANEFGTSIIFVSSSGDLPSKYDLSISEYPDGSKITRERCKEKNRLIAAIANKILILNSEKDSGIMNLVSNALEIGKEIFCYPDDHKHISGNTELIRDGARIFTKYQDLILN